MSEEDTRSRKAAPHLPDPSRVVVVTGGTGGLGSRIVRQFSTNGNPVHVPVRRGTRSRRGGSTDQGHGSHAESPSLSSELSDRGPVTLHTCDVTDPEAVDAFFTEVAEVEGSLDILVNGVGGFDMAPVVETWPGEWRKMMDVNATSAFLCSRSAAPYMKESGWGRIVNVASIPALERGSPGMAAYGASKTALLHLTCSLADELVEDGVTVNAVVPTVIDTPANREAMPDASRDHWLDPAEIAQVVDFLASDAAQIVTGAAIRLSRG
ncbi:MAG: SDR family NAD(P)-dependent oxidoreductase [Longimicrobiales bacterium]